MPRWFSRRLVPAVTVTAVLALAACTSSSAGTSGASGTCTPAAVPTLTFAAYSTPREVYDAKIIPAFKAMWEGQDRRRAAVSNTVPVPYFVKVRSCWSSRARWSCGSASATPSPASPGEVSQPDVVQIS